MKGHDWLQFAPLPSLARGSCKHTHRQAVAIAEAVVDRSGLAEILEWSLTSHTGAPRKVSWRTVLVVYAVAGILAEDMLITRIADVATDLHREGLLDAPVSYWQVWEGLTKMAAALSAGAVTTAHTHPLVVDRRTGEVADCPPGCTGGATITLTGFATALLSTSGLHPRSTSTTMAIDSTDLETWAARRSWDRLPDISTTDGEEVPDPDTVESSRDHKVAGWPKRGHDGRAQHTVDPDARAGYRSGKNLRRKDTFVGYDLHLITQVPELDTPPVPHTALTLVTAPAGSSKATAGLLAVDSLRQAGHQLTDLISDRGYSYLRAESWALQLRARGIASIHDLHTRQRGVHPGPVAHTLWVDGALFTDALPEKLRDLPQFSLKMGAEEVAELTARYDQRIPYAFGRQGQPHPVTGTQRFRGPARRLTVRCPNNPASMRASYSKPLTTCTPGQPCGCSVTREVLVEEFARERQAALWGTTAHKASYGRRSAIESLNAEIRTNRGSRLGRGCTRVFGLAKNHLLMAFKLLGANVRILRDWYISRSQPDPWMDQIGDTSDPDWATLHANRKRHPRRRSLHERLAHPQIELRALPPRRAPKTPDPGTGPTPPDESTPTG